MVIIMGRSRDAVKPIMPKFMVGDLTL